ncbi:hypothetical protein D3C76_1314050 [compost metagenome]
MSPGASTSISFTSLPVLPPSSKVVTTAVIFDVYSLSPLNILDSPLPPPIITTLGPFFNVLFEYNNFFKLIFCSFPDKFFKDNASTFL